MTTREIPARQQRRASALRQCTLFLSIVLSCGGAGLCLGSGPTSQAAATANQARGPVDASTKVVNCGDYASLQRCHDGLPWNGGIMLVPGSRTYILDSTLRIAKDNVWLIGGGQGSTVIQRAPGLSGGDLIHVTGSGFLITALTLDGNAVASQTAELGLGGANATVDGIEVERNGFLGIAVAAANVKITASRIIGLASPTVGMYGVWFDNSEVDNLLISDNVLKDHTLGALFGSGRNITITRNRLSGNHQQVYPTGGGQIAIKGVATNSNIVLSDNVLDQGGGYLSSGIEIDGPPVSIIGNDIRGQKLHGIILQSGYGHHVVGNTVSSSGTGGIPMPGITVNPGVSGFNILGNRAYDEQTNKTQSWGIRIEPGSSANFTVAGNDLRGNLSAAGISNASSGPGLIYGNLSGN